MNFNWKIAINLFDIIDTKYINFFFIFIFGQIYFLIMQKQQWKCDRNIKYSIIDRFFSLLYIYHSNAYRKVFCKYHPTHKDFFFFSFLLFRVFFLIFIFLNHNFRVKTLETIFLFRNPFFFYVFLSSFIRFYSKNTFVFISILAIIEWQKKTKQKFYF